MDIEYEILFNKYGQEIIPAEVLVAKFLEANEPIQLDLFNHLLFIILQSKALDSDVEYAIKRSNLKPSLTPCVILKKGVGMNNLKKIINLPSNEKLKSFRLLLELFKVAYERKYKIEKNDPMKWWYWDLSIPSIENKIYQNYNTKATQ